MLVVYASDYQQVSYECYGFGEIGSYFRRRMTKYDVYFTHALYFFVLSLHDLSIVTMMLRCLKHLQAHLGALHQGMCRLVAAYVNARMWLHEPLYG